MTKHFTQALFDEHFYLFGSRAATHLGFWLVYFVAFGIIWMKPEQGYLASFYLEFVLLPVRLMAVYGMIYVLMPRYLLQRRFQRFGQMYLVMIVFAGFLQRLADHYFYDSLFLQQPQAFWSAAEWLRSILLVNSTVVFVASVRLLQLYLGAQARLQSTTSHRIPIRANRQTQLVDAQQILNAEGLGNYVTYVLKDGHKYVSHGTLKAAQQKLPSTFVRVHRSYLVNRQQLSAFTHDQVTIGDVVLPRGKDVSDETLLCYQ